jgi:hypothetical protein
MVYRLMILAKSSRRDIADDYRYHRAFCTSQEGLSQVPWAIAA